MANNIYDWQFNCIPGNANQGSIFFTRNDIGRPPFNQDDFIWKAMEDIIGVANCRLDYDEEENMYHLYKAKGHLDNEDVWHYDWELVGSWAALTPEVVEILRMLNYVNYIYDTSTANTLKVYGVNKDGTRDLLVNINFASTQYVDTAVNSLRTALNNEITRATNKENEIANNLTNEITRSTNKDNELETNLNAEINRATNRENELEDMIEHSQAISGSATTVTQSSNGRIVDVNVDDDSIKVGSDNKLKADVFDDTQVRSDKGWSSAKISQELTSAMHYKGQVATYADLPTTGQAIGDVYNVADTGDNYAWNGTSWDKLSGEYIPGVGIDIQGKVISATGIAFQVGDGLQTSGTGTTTTLLTKNGDGLEYGSNRENKVKAGNAVTVDANGVGVNTGNTTQTVNDNIEVKPDKGLKNESTGLSINANFNIKTTPLGTDSSKLALYSDGKIAVDFTESPVVIEGQLLATGNVSIGTNRITSLTVPNLSDYDMIAIETELGTQYYPKGISAVRQSHIIPNIIGSPGSAPVGISVYMTLIRSINWDTNTLYNIEWWYKTTFDSSGSWTAINASATSSRYIKVYGMKAR